MEEMHTMSLRSQTNARLTCHAWEISGQLRKHANRFPQSRDNILGYSARLEAISRSLLSLFPILNSLPKRDVMIPRHHLGACHRFLKTLHGLQELLAICTSNSKLQPVILLPGEKRLSPLSEDAHLQFQQALSSMEASIRLTICSMRESFKYNGELCSDLEVLFEWVAASLQCPSTQLKVRDAASSQDCLTFAYEELAVTKDASSPAEEGHLTSTRTNVVDLPGIRALQVKPVTALLSNPVVGYFPDLGSLSWIDNCGEHWFVQQRSQLSDPEDMIRHASFFERLLENRQSGYQATFAERLIDYKWDQETQRSAGSLVLHDTLMTSHNHGRIKEREVLLFQNRLLFLRNKDHLKMVVWNISLWEDIILVAYDPKGILRREIKDTGSLTVYWKTEVAGKPRVSGVKIYFKELSSLELWAAFLALDPKPPEPLNTSNDVSTSVDIQATSLTPEDTEIQDPVSVSQQDTKTGRKRARKSFWSAISRIKEWQREEQDDMGLREREALNSDGEAHRSSYFLGVKIRVKY